MKSPRLARLLIRITAPRAYREDVVGDFEEAHRRWLQSHVDALRISAGFIHQRLFHVGMFSDVRLAFRMLRRQPLTALTTIVALTAGIGLATVGFAAMEALLYSQLPFDGGDRFVRLRPYSPRDGSAVPLPADAYARLAGVPALVHLGAATGERRSVALAGRVPEVLTLSSLTPSSLPYVGARPAAGRLFTSADAAPGATPVALVSARLAQRTNLVTGGTVSITGTAYTVVGIMPADFAFPNAPDLWLPLDERFQRGEGELATDARLYGVRAPDTSLERLSAQVNAAVMPTLPAGSPVTVGVTDFTDLGDMAPMLATAIVLTVVAVLVVIAANVGNLILARSFARAREFALRTALGASRTRLVTQVMTEVLVLGGIAAIGGTIAARVVLKRFNTMKDIPYWVDFTGGPLTFVLVVITTLSAAAIAGAWPAFKATRGDVLGAIHGGGLRSSDVRFGRVAGAMVITQVAVSVVMLHGALVVAQAFRHYTDPHLALPANVLTLGVPVNAGTPVTAADVQRLVDTIPGVIAAGLTTSLPRHSPEVQRVEVESADPDVSRLAPSAAVSPSFFDALGATVQTGRNFSETDAAPGAPPVVIVNEPFAREWLRGAPLGQRIRTVGDGTVGPWREVVGVVPDLGLSVGDASLRAGYYVPLTSDASLVFVAMRVAGEPLQWTEPVWRALQTLDPALVPGRAVRLAEVNMEDRAFFVGLSSALVGLGVVTLVLALVGLYSMMSLIVARRTREIGIRLALGASVSHVIRTIGARAALQIGIGGVVGAALAVASLRARSVLVSRMGDGGAWTLPLVLALLVVAGLVATWVPLRRALIVRPQDALRAE
jgi:putative ABC transport system permease protein